MWAESGLLPPETAGVGHALVCVWWGWGGSPGDLPGSSTLTRLGLMELLPLSLCPSAWLLATPPWFVCALAGLASPLWSLPEAARASECPLLNEEVRCSVVERSSFCHKHSR